MNTLTFDKDLHEYKIDGKPVPSYSQIARDLGLVDFSRVSEVNLKYKQEVGLAVHLAIFYANDGRLLMDSLDDVVRSYYNSWMLFVDMYKPTIMTDYSENPICSFRWNYGITPDIVMEQKGGLTVLELKCVSSMNPATALQTAAQKIALEETYKLKIKHRWGLQLIPNDIPKISAYLKSTDESSWKSAVNTWYWKKANGLWTR